MSRCKKSLSLWNINEGRKKGSRSEPQARGQLSWLHHVLAQESKEHRNYDIEPGLPCDYRNISW